jgi:hypothetical protein
MFVYTAKLNKRKALLSVIIFALIIMLIIILVSVLRDGGGSSVISEDKIKDSGDVILYLNSLGWETEKEPLEIKEIVIPREFTGVYADYIDLQKSQGYTIDQYGGLEATRNLQGSYTPRG